MRRLPEALSATTSGSVGALATVAPASFNMTQLGQPTNGLSTVPHTGTGDLALTLFSGATAVDAADTPAIRAVAALPVMIQDRAGSQMAMPLNLAGPMTAGLSTAVRAAGDRDSIGIPAPSFRPPMDLGAAFGLGNRAQAESAVLAPVPADAMLHFWERVGSDGADDTSGEPAEVQHGGHTVANSAAAVALVFGLAGWAAQPTDKESKKRQRPDERT